MEDNKFKKIGVFCFLFFVFIIFCKITFYKLFFIIDISREVYFPEAILKGDVLYKDIFNIYGPISYYINAFWYFILGLNIKTLYIAGITNLLLILVLTYLISRRFLNFFTSTVITLFVSACGFELFFGYVLPYAYAFVYGYSFFLISVYLYLVHIDKKSSEKQILNTSESQTCEIQKNSLLSKFFSDFNYDNLFLCLSFIFAGLAATTKYEFIPYAFFLFCHFIITNKNHRDFINKTFFCSLYLFLVPILSFIPLVIKGLTLKHFYNYFVLMAKYVTSEGLRNLYLNQAFVNRHIWSADLIFFVTVFIIFCLLVSFFVKIIKIKGDISTFLSLTILFIWLKLHSFYYVNYYNLLTICFYCFYLIPYVIVLLFAIPKLQNIFSKSKYKITYDSSIVFIFYSFLFVALKFFFAFIIFLSEANYITGITVIVFFALFKNCLKKYRGIYNILVIALAFISMMVFSSVVQYCDGFKNQPILKISKGSFYFTSSEYYHNFNNLYQYINKNTKPSDKLIVLPEGAIINFLTNRKSDNFYNIFTPDRFEAYQEENIIKHYKKCPPEYFVIFHYEHKSYLKGDFCDYAKNVCEYIKTNYNRVYNSPTFNYDIDSVELYKRNDID